MPRKKAVNGTASRRKRITPAPSGFFTAPDGKHYPLNGLDRTTAVYRWKQSRTGGSAPADSGLGGEVSADQVDSGRGDDDSNIGGNSELAGSGTDSGDGDDVGSPRIVRRRTQKRGAGTKQKGMVSSLDIEVDDDIAKINALVVGTFGAIASMRQFPGWQVSEADALQISKPLNEILKKYPKLAEKVLDASAPVALVTSVVWITGPRVVADRVWHAQLQAAKRQASTPQAPPANRPQPVGAIPVNSHGEAFPNGQPHPDRSQNGTETGFPKDLSASAAMWAADAQARDFDGLPVA